MVNGVVQAAFVEHSLCSLTFMMRDSVKNTVWRCIYCNIDHLADWAAGGAVAGQPVCQLANKPRRQQSRSNRVKATRVRVNADTPTGQAHQDYNRPQAGLSAGTRQTHRRSA